LNVGVQNFTGTGTTVTGNLLLSAGAGRTSGGIDALVSTLLVGSGSSGSLAGTGTGTVEMDQGTIDATSVILGQSNAGSAGGTNTGTFNLKGGNLITGSITLGSKAGSGTGVGILNLTGGTATLSGNISDGGGSSTLSLNGGVLDMGGFNIGSGAQVIDTLTFASGTLKNVGEINGGVALNKTTGGTLFIEGTNTYTGPTNVDAGKVVVGGSVAGDINVASGATLASGHNLSSQVAAISAASDLVNGATVAPGDTGGGALSTIGVLNSTGNVSLGVSGGGNQAAHLSIEIGGTASDGSEYDQVRLIGASSTLTLDNVDLDLLAVNSFNPTALTLPTMNIGTGQFNLDGDKFFLIIGSTAPVGGTFANQGGPAPEFLGYNTITLGNQLFAISYHANFGAQTFDGGNDVALMVIPEPNSWAMLAGSFGMALGLRRFRSSRRRSMRS
jgi:autotransporter-associated beta strand protein